MNLIELHRANYELRKEIEAKEAKFEQEIKVAWNRPRPPPVTNDQRRDRAALEKIESKEIFDELGDQQRPIKTDAYLIVHETQIEMMIERARTCNILKDYRRMYTRANQAVEAASLLTYPPLMARCCYYRGMASYHHGDLGGARDDFVEARGCAGLYGITSQSIERYIHLIDSGVDPETARLEQLSAPRVSRDRDTGRTKRARRNESSPSSADAATLVGDLPRSPEHPSSSPIEEDDPSDHPQISRRRTLTPALAPITTSLAPTTAARDSMREHASDPPGDIDDVYERGSDEMGSDEMYAAFGGRFREGDTPDSALTPVSARWSYK